LKAAQKKAQEIADALETGDPTALQALLGGSASSPKGKGQQTFAEFAREYMQKYAEVNKTGPSYKRDWSSLNCHLLPVFGDKLLNRITARDIETYKMTRRDKEAGNPATVNRELALLKAVFKKAFAWGEIKHNPALTVTLFKEAPVIPSALTDEQVEKLLKACQQSRNPHLYPLVVCALETGMRRSELFDLTWKDVDLEGRWIIVRRSKNNEFRTIPISDLLHQVLMEHKAKGHIPFVFGGKKGRCNGVRRSLSTAGARAGIEHLHLHVLRHTFATRYRSRGVGLEAIQELLGHRTTIMTRRYAKVTPEYLRNAVRQGGGNAPGLQQQNQEQTGPGPGMVREPRVLELRRAGSPSG
jgi:integrase